VGCPGRYLCVSTDKGSTGQPLAAWKANSGELRSPPCLELQLPIQAIQARLTSTALNLQLPRDITICRFSCDQPPRTPLEYTETQDSPTLPSRCLWQDRNMVSIPEPPTPPRIAMPKICGQRGNKHKLTPTLRPGYQVGYYFPPLQEPERPLKPFELTNPQSSPGLAAH
jgi:hypothetical protein